MDVINIQSKQEASDGSTVAGMWSQWDEGISTTYKRLVPNKRLVSNKRSSLTPKNKISTVGGK